MLQTLQASGESYDRARETLKHVSVDASGKVELEDWVEVRTDSVMSHLSEPNTSYSSTQSYDLSARRLYWRLRLEKSLSKAQMQISVTQ